MKKMIAFLMMVMMIMSFAMAEEEGVLYNATYSEANKIVEDWCEDNGLYDWQIKNDVNGVLYACGVLCIEDFEEETQIGCTIENWVNESMERWDMKKCIVRKVGETENGINIYRVNAEANQSLGIENGKEYYKMDIIFCCFSRYEKE